MDDLISRKKAIDIGRRATVDTNPSHFDSHQKFEQFMDDVEISSFGRWQWANGFNTALTAISIDLKQLPSAEPVLSKAMDRVSEMYEKALKSPYVQKPLAWALYQVWKEYDR